MVVDLIAEATGDATVSIEGAFLKYGLIGAVALALGIFAVRTIAATEARIAATEARARRLEDDNRRLYTTMTDEMIPALTRARDTATEVAAVLAEVNRREERAAAVEEARRGARRSTT